jgi:urease accessory protein
MKKHNTIATLLALFSSVANAHPGHGLDTAYAGFMHPMTGWDHLLAMLAVGLWAAKIGGKARWQLPLTFVSVMAVGVGLGAAGIYLAGVETAIVASVMAMGVLLMLRLPINTGAQLGITAIFALLHGMAHGVELQVTSSMLAVTGGMLVATALLHGVGLFVGMQCSQIAHRVEKLMACLMLLVGAYLLIA